MWTREKISLHLLTERFDQILSLTSKNRTWNPKWQRCPAGGWTAYEGCQSCCTHPWFSSNSELFHHSRAKRQTASAKRLTSKRQKSRNYFHKAHHRQVQRNNLRVFMTHLHWHYAWWIHRWLKPFVGRDLGQPFKRHWCEGVLWLPGPPSR